MEILVGLWNMEDTVPEWNGRFQERNGRQSFLLPYQFCTGPQPGCRTEPEPEP